jgi:hypothetical protein
MPIFASKVAFFSVFRALIVSFAPFQIFLIFQDLCTIFTEFGAIFAEFQERQQILQIFIKISPIFFGISSKFQ